MREIIGEFMSNPLSDMNINATLAYSGCTGYWYNFEVWQMSDDDYEKLCAVSDAKWDDDKYVDSWWRGADGSNMGTVNYEFTIRGKKIDAWYNEYTDDYLIERWDRLDKEEKLEYGFDKLDYINAWHQTEYEDLLEYFCEELHASTERNVCALVTDMARQNEITVAELFRQYC